MPRVILHAGQLLDDASDPGQRPEVRAEAMRVRALAQGGLDADHLLPRQPRLPAGAAGGPQRPASALAPRAIPAHDALAADPQHPGDGPLRVPTRGKQACGLLATNFESVEIPSWCSMSGHAVHRTTEGLQLSLYYARLNRRPAPWPRMNTRGFQVGAMPQAGAASGAVVDGQYLRLEIAQSGAHGAVLRWQNGAPR